MSGLIHEFLKVYFPVTKWGRHDLDSALSEADGRLFRGLHMGQQAQKTRQPSI